MQSMSTCMMGDWLTNGVHVRTAAYPGISSCLTVSAAAVDTFGGRASVLCEGVWPPAILVYRNWRGTRIHKIRGTNIYRNLGATHNHWNVGATVSYRNLGATPSYRKLYYRPGYEYEKHRGITTTTPLISIVFCMITAITESEAHIIIGVIIIMCFCLNMSIMVIDRRIQSV